jgi:hypothetical protein
MKNKRIKNVAWPQEEGDAINRNYLYRSYYPKQYINSLVSLKPHQVILLDQFNNTSSDLKLLEVAKLKIFILTGKVFITTDTTTETNVIANFPTLTTPYPIIESVAYFQNEIFPDFKTITARSIYSYGVTFVIDTDKNLIVY